MPRTKTPADITAIKQSVAAAQAAMTAVGDYLTTADEPTSEQAHDIIDQTLALHDCSSPQGHIVACGPASAQPHERGSGPILPGQPIVIDIYPQHNATHWFADMTRTVCLGEPSAELEDMHSAVKTVLADSAAHLRPGASCDQLHQQAVDQFVAMGYQTSGVGTEFKYAQGFVHSLGHGVGQDVHIEPFFGNNRGHTLQTGDVVTLEPALYYNHIGGVRLEDMFLITEGGCEQLTGVPLVLRL